MVKLAFSLLDYLDSGPFDMSAWQTSAAEGGYYSEQRSCQSVQVG
jgi:hypothetical protein